MRTTTLLLAGLLTLAAAPTVFAQAPAPKITMPKAGLLRDGAFRRQGQMMRLQAGRASRVGAPVGLANGTTVRPNGLLVTANGRRQLLPENHAVTMQGAVVLLRDDMLTPRAIDERAQAVLGSTGETRIAVPAKPMAGTQLPPRLTARLLRAEQRLALLEEMTARLEQRTRPTSASTKPLDRQLSQVNAELRTGLSATGTATDAPQ